MMTSTPAFPVCFFEITGGCNARCPWCVTGRTTGGPGPKRFIAVERFSEALDRLLGIGAICPKQTVGLYNWGEPTLHPRLYDILAELSKRGLFADLNSNGSIPPKLSRVDTLSNVVGMSFSLPGFSQASQDRIHGFEFDRVLHNIGAWIEALDAVGRKGSAWINFHIYQFSLDEFLPARHYFMSRYGVETLPSMAYIADWNLCMDYLKDRLDAATMRRLSSSLFLHYVDGMLATKPRGFSCPQFDWLTLDEECNVVRCCTLAPDHPEYRIGSVFDLSLDEIRAAKRQGGVCGPCIEDGVVYWSFSAPVPGVLNQISHGGFQNLGLQAVRKV